MIGAVFFTGSPVVVPILVLILVILADYVTRPFFSFRATYTNAPGRLAVYAIINKESNL
jgi:hypothetical protein